MCMCVCTRLVCECVCLYALCVYVYVCLYMPCGWVARVGVYVYVHVCVYLCVWVYISEPSTWLMVDNSKQSSFPPFLVFLQAVVQEDLPEYEIEYVSVAQGWAGIPSRNPPIGLKKLSGLHHYHPIVHSKTSLHHQVYLRSTQINTNDSLCSTSPKSTHCVSTTSDQPTCHFWNINYIIFSQDKTMSWFSMTFGLKTLFCHRGRQGASSLESWMCFQHLCPWPSHSSLLRLLSLPNSPPFSLGSFSVKLCKIVPHHYQGHHP